MNSNSIPCDHPICTNAAGLFDSPNESTSIGHTETQIPQPMHEVFLLLSSFCFNAKFMTSMPTWQLREHSPQAMHLSLAVILNFPNHLEYRCINLASGHQ